THSTLDVRLEEQQRTRQVARLLHFDALDRGQQGDMAGALESCRACFNAARSLGDEPFGISQLIRIAVAAIACDMVERALAQGEAADADLAALQQALVLEEKHPTLLVAMRGERAGVHDLFTKLGNGTITTDQLIEMLNLTDIDLLTRTFRLSR